MTNKRKRITQDRPKMQMKVTLMKKICTLLGFFTEITKSKYTKVERDVACYSAQHSYAPPS